jgi:peptidoglycan-N-acetylglucosamine deacetylase
MTPAGEASLPIVRSWRRPVLGLLLGAHLAAVPAALAEAWLLLALLVLPTHLLIWWGTLRPGSCLLVPAVRRFDTGAREIWLTIDDGPSADTAAMLALLTRHRARATFFVVGRRAEAEPGLIAQIIAAGHSIGNHSHTHPSALFWALPPAAMAREIGNAQRALSRLAGSAPRLFRAAVGMANPFVAPLLVRHGLHCIGWSARAFDSIEADPETVWRRLQRDLRPGAIVLLHEGAGHGRSTAILARVLDGLAELGYRCVLPQLLDATAMTGTAEEAGCDRSQPA